MDLRSICAIHLCVKLKGFKTMHHFVIRFVFSMTAAVPVPVYFIIITLMRQAKQVGNDINPK